MVHWKPLFANLYGNTGPSGLSLDMFEESWYATGHDGLPGVRVEVNETEPLDESLHDWFIWGPGDSYLGLD